MSEFQIDVAEELTKARRAHQGSRSHHEGYAVLLELAPADHCGCGSAQCVRCRDWAGR